MKQKPNKLVLFDIDGTLVRTDSDSIKRWRNNVVEIFRTVFYKELSYDFDIRIVNGKLDRIYMWELAKTLGISKQEYDAKFPRITELSHTLLKKLVDDKDITFYRIEDAYTFVSHIARRQEIAIGLITGNTEKNARLKLEAAGFDITFPVGGYGDEKDTRGELVTHAIQKAGNHFGTTFIASETIVIGDTIHDASAAQHAGAQSIVVATGITDTLDILEQSGAQLAVRSLMDERVLELLQLKVTINS